MAVSKLNPIEGGIPKGNTSNRSTEFPSPAVGDVYYNGQLEILEIYNGSSWVANSAPPAVPSIVSVTDVGTGLAYSTGGTLTVVVAPGSGGSTPLQYNVVTSAGGFSTSSNSTTLSLTGLTSNTSFVVSANVQNNFGTTVNSSPFASTLVTTVPQASTIGTATASGNSNEVTVIWTLGNTGGKNLSAITITPYLNGTTAETARTAATTSSTSYTFTDGQLTAGSSYTFKVKVANANGDSLESAASNSATMPNFITVEYLTIAGGGSGGTGSGDGSSEGAGGGGAGGYLTSSIGLTKSTNYTVIVGGGGAGVSGDRNYGNAGVNSVFGSTTSTGGGRGGKGTGGDGGSGGSGGGGGAGIPAGAGGARTSSPVQGNNGGAGNQSASAGGGGGAGAVGVSGVADGGGGRGGAGLASSITGTSVTRAGGGGAGGYASTGTSDGAGGSGGGGNGGNPGNGTAGTANTGSGGGGGGRPGYTSGAGGSGVVILRYLTAEGTITIGAGLTGSTATDGSYQVTTITAGSGNVSWS
jgi:hypothetical protein